MQKESQTTIKKKEEETGNTIKMGKIGFNKKKEDPSKNYYEAGGANSAGKFDVKFNSNNKKSIVYLNK